MTRTVLYNLLAWIIQILKYCAGCTFLGDAIRSRLVLVGKGEFLDLPIEKIDIEREMRKFVRDGTLMAPGKDLPRGAEGGFLIDQDNVTHASLYPDSTHRSYTACSDHGTPQDSVVHNARHRPARFRIRKMRSQMSRWTDASGAHLPLTERLPSSHIGESDKFHAEIRSLCPGNHLDPRGVRRRPHTMSLQRTVASHHHQMPSSLQTIIHGDQGTLYQHHLCRRLQSVGK